MCRLDAIHPGNIDFDIAVALRAGLFNESLPDFLRDADAAAPGRRLANVTFLHIDCDLYGGAPLRAA